ncbi:MAG: PAS domain-containing sensor histidine kinase [Elusimicrobia bacterium]|nr:PAS domain-containing sensor histidine kinase [Elusimicrobiota bacterium]
MAKVSASVKRFITSDYKLESVLPKEGWRESEDLISAFNRLTLELSAYHAFHLSQIVEERAKAEALVETIPDGVLLVDDRGRLIYSNKVALKMLGIPKPDTSIALPGSVSREAFQVVLKDILTSQEDFLKAEVAVPHPDETYAIVRNFRVISRRFPLATLKAPGRVLIIRDVTVEKEIESARETFFHMITHDMRVPLTSIHGYASLLARFVSASPEADKCLRAILRSSVRLKGMIEDILNTIKLERGALKLRLDTVDAGVLCAQVFEIHEPLAALKSIKFSAVPPPSKIEFQGDSLLLERIITNLVGNALKFTPRGGVVTVHCRQEPGEVVFFIEDTGPGIPEDKQKEIFAKYTQLEEHKYLGFGLGLAMCRMAVELHKGRIWVQSSEGKGSKFIFSIPTK